MAKEEKKGLFGKAVDALSSKDEKEEIERLEKELAAAKAESKKAAAQTTTAASQAVKAAEERAAKAEKELRILKAKADMAARHAATQKAKAAMKKTIAEHTVGEGDTLSGIALKYYGHATRDYWMVIYEANKAAIGDNPGIIRPGTELEIPELPENLKD